MIGMRSQGAVAVLAVAGALAYTPRAEANLFGLFHTRHRETTTEVACCTPVVPVCSSCQTPVVAAPAPAAFVAAAPPVAACPAPQPIAVPETCMTQRCYQVPVVHNEVRTAYQLVTSYQTSMVTEPVTTMRTSSYFDPCGCGYHQVTTPCTTYVQKAVVTPIQRYVAQHYVVPVTTFRQECVNEPVTRIRYYYPGAAPVAVGVAAPPAAVAGIAGVATAPAGAMMPQGQQQQAGPPSSIAMPPQNGNIVPNAPGGSSDALKAVPKESAQDGKQYYPPPSPFTDKPNRREEVDNVYRNGELYERRWRLVDPGEQPSASSSQGSTANPQTLAPRPPGPVSGAGAAKGSSYAPPKEPLTIPKGTKTASWSEPEYYHPATTVVLSKPYYQ
jgi:hypothetical protein